MALIPDLSTAVIDPFWETPTLSFISNTVEADTKILFQDDPREVARRAEKSLKDSKFATHSLWGPEFEFYILTELVYENRSNTASYRMDAAEAMWNSDIRGLQVLHPNPWGLSCHGSSGSSLPNSGEDGHDT